MTDHYKLNEYSYYQCSNFSDQDFLIIYVTQYFFKQRNIPGVFIAYATK